MGLCGGSPFLLEGVGDFRNGFAIAADARTAAARAPHVGAVLLLW